MGIGYTQLTLSNFIKTIGFGVSISTVMNRNLIVAYTVPNNTTDKMEEQLSMFSRLCCILSPRHVYLDMILSHGRCFKQTWAPPCVDQRSIAVVSV